MYSAILQLWNVSACGVDKKLSKMVGNSTSYVHCVEGSLIDLSLNSYSYVANCKLASWRYCALNVQLRFSRYLSLCVSGGFFQSQSHMWLSERKPI